MNNKLHSLTFWYILHLQYNKRDWHLRSSGILRIVEWQFGNDVSGQPICGVGHWRWDKSVVPKRRYRTALPRSVKSHNSADIIRIAPEDLNEPSAQNIHQSLNYLKNKIKPELVHEYVRQT
jgi:hypothetical protein